MQQGEFRALLLHCLPPEALKKHLLQSHGGEKKSLGKQSETEIASEVFILSLSQPF